MRWLILASTILILSLPAARAQGPITNADAHVVLISIDGFAASRLEDQSLELPNLRALVRSGAWAESSETVLPAIDHPAHTSITTGVAPAVHGVIGNRLLNRETGEYFHITNKPRAESIKVPTLFDAAKQAGLTTAAFFWPETREDPSIDFGIPATLTGTGLASISGSDPAFLRELRDNQVPIDLFFQWAYDVALQTSADRLLTRSAAYVLETYKPNFLAIRLPATDRYQHRYGPDHYLSKAAFTTSDANVGILREAVERAGMASTTTFVVVSDHGFHAVPYSVNVWPLFRDAGLLGDRNAGLVGDRDAGLVSDRDADLLGKVRLHTGFWSVEVELTGEFRPDRDQGRLDDTLESALGLEGVTRVIRPDERQEMGLPRYEDDPHVLGHYTILGDIDTLVMIDENSDSTRRTRLDRPFFGHGDTWPSHELMYPVFVAAGRGIKENVRIGHIHNFDIAPTISALLGLEMPGLPGRVLDEILDQR